MFSDEIKGGIPAKESITILQKGRGATLGSPQMQGSSGKESIRKEVAPVTPDENYWRRRFLESEKALKTAHEIFGVESDKLGKIIERQAKEINRYEIIIKDLKYLSSLPRY